MFLRAFLIFSCIVFSQFTYSKEVIEFLDEDLETETVVPVFSKLIAVKDRNIVLTKKIELSFNLGLALNEPLYNPLLLGISGTYHLDEAQGINFSLLSMSGGLTDNAKKLANGDGGKEFDASKAPHPSMLLSANYEYSLYYGKLSFSKKTVYSTSVYALGGLGIIQFGGLSEVVVNLGFGQKLFFSPKWALKLDLMFSMYQGPDPTSQNLRSIDPTPAESAFAKRSYFSQYLTAGLVAIF